MMREVRYGVAALRGRPRPLLALAAWSVPEALPAGLSGFAVAKAVDAGFLAGRPAVGLAWLAGLLLAAGVGAAGARQVYRHVGELVEPFRDTLVDRVVGAALRHGIAGRADGGAVARLTRQVELVRDTYAGLIMVLRGFAVALVGAVAGILAVAPELAMLVLPPFLLGLAAFLATLGFAATRYRTSVLADERVAAVAGQVLAGARDVVASGAEQRAAGMVAGPVAEQADAERAIARVAALRVLCFAVGGWLPVVILLAAGPWLLDRGLTTGVLMGGLTYLLTGLQPALHTLINGLGGGGLRFVVTLGRILDASEPPASDGRDRAAHRPEPRGAGASRPPALALRGVTFAYGPHAEPVLRELDLTVPDGAHLAVMGPSGIGKSTLAGLLCGLLRPDAGTVLLDGVPVSGQSPVALAYARVLIPQEAYVFAGTLRDNLTYLRPAADRSRVAGAVEAVGAEPLVCRVGGLDAELRPAELSAGERQLIALVRAYLSPAPLAVLDEATCHLDPVAERRAEEAFALRYGTLVVIAHRTSSVLRADQVAVLDGTSVTVGDHQTLAATSAQYRDLIDPVTPVGGGFGVSASTTISVD